MQTAFHASTEEILIRLLLQISVILLAARVVGCLFKRVGQSQAIGEIFAGVMLGPSLFGWLFPGAFHALFPSEGPQVLPFFSHLGLVLTLFLIGMEFDYREVPAYGKQVVGIAMTTLLLPLITGVALAFWLWSVAPGQNTFLSYALFVGLTLAITAIPIMGRILMELKLTKSQVGLLGITSGAFKDLCTWFLLAVVIGFAKPPLDLWKVSRMILLTAALAGIVLTVGRRILERAERAFPVKDGKVNPNLLSGLLIMLLLLSAATSKIGIFAIFGAFLAGVAISHRRQLSEAVSDRLHDLTILFFLPIFFTYTGLRADLSQLGGGLWLWVVIVTVAGTLVSGGPAYALARYSGMTHRASASLAALINTPGLMVLILLNIGMDLNVVPPTLFSILMANALIRDLFTTPILKAYKAKELDVLPVSSTAAWKAKGVAVLQPSQAQPAPSPLLMSPRSPQG